MGEQGGLRTGWLAAFGTEGYEGEPALLEELGVNFGHIKVKVCGAFLSFFFFVCGVGYAAGGWMGFFFVGRGGFGGMDGWLLMMMGW